MISDDSPSVASRPDHVERDAAEWVMRHQQGLTRDEKEKFSDWLRRDPQHAAVFAEMSMTSEMLDQLRDPALAGEKKNSALPTSFSGPARTRRFWLAPALLAAAAVVMACGIWWRSALVVRPYNGTAVTEIGALRELDLPDGSVIRLNTDSAIEVNYSENERNVRLVRGEAYFTVAKNQNRPFGVQVGAVSVQAVGTAFNVRARGDGVEVLVTEGKVRVDESPSEPSTASFKSPETLPSLKPSHTPSEQFVAAGERIMIPAQPMPGRELTASLRVARVAHEEMARMLAWRERRLEFDATPLVDVVAEFNRYNRHKLVIDDPDLGAQRFGGAFSLHGYESLIEILTQNFGVSAERREGVTVLRRIQ